MLLKDLLENVNIEDKFHKIYITKDKLINKGVTSSILEWITLYDECLSSYLFSNQDLIIDLKKKVEKNNKKLGILRKK